MLHINYMHFRRDFYPLIIKILNGVKRPFKFNFLTDQSQPFDAIGDYFFENAKFEYSIQVFRRHDNYRPKIQWALDQSNDNDTFMKLDEDQFMSPALFEYFIDNHDVVHGDPFWLAAWSPNGVTSADEFANKFFDEDTLQRYRTLCLSTRIGKDANTICPGASPKDQLQYDELNKSTIYAEQWDSDYWYEILWQVEHFWRGIHPTRINFALTKLVNEFVLNHIESFFGKEYFIYETKKYPYYCNSHYITNKPKLGQIVKCMHERQDFDEVAMNLLRLQQDAPMAFVGNSCVIHSLYSNARCPLYENEWSNPNGNVWEDEFYRQLYNILEPLL